MAETIRARQKANHGDFDRDQLRRLRVGKRLTWEALGRRIGASRTAVKAWEDGEYEPRFSQVKKLADEFGLSVEFFLKPAEAR